jgi:uncharacterized protein (DUF1778 family)
MIALFSRITTKIFAGPNPDTDVVQRLMLRTVFAQRSLMHEAAEEITELRNENDFLVEALHDLKNEIMADKLRREVEILKASPEHR